MNPGGGSSGFGGYHDPLGGISAALGATADESRWRMKPGSSSWSGVIAQRVLIDSPLAGSTVLGL